MLVLVRGGGCSCKSQQALLLPLKPKDDSNNETAISKQAVFSSAEFMKFLSSEIDISKMIFETKDGQRISASFNGPTVKSSGPPPSSGSSIFKSLDMFKSLESTSGDSIDPALAKSTVSLEFFPSADGTDPFSSREWAADWKNSHVEVSYSNAFGDPTTNGMPSMSSLGDAGDVGMANGGGGGGGSASLPPKKRAAAAAVKADTPNDKNNGKNKTDWTAMFKNALKPLVDAASAAEREPHHPPPGGILGLSRTTAVNPPTQNKPAGRRKPRKIIPENKEYVEISEKVCQLSGKVVFTLLVTKFSILNRLFFSFDRTSYFLSLFVLLL